MGKITVEEKVYGSWGKCVRISNGEVELFVTVEIGPRIIRFARVDGPNIMYEDVERSFFKDEETMKLFGENERWYIYGGHRFWQAPEALPRTYLPENYPVEYEIWENGVTLKPRPMTAVGTQNEMDISMKENGEVTIEHRVTNIGPWEKELAPWALSVIAHGGKAVIPLSTRDTGLLSNRNLILWPYTRINDERVCWHDKYVSVTPAEQSAFKIGTNCEDGYMLYFVNNDMFVKYFNYDKDAVYPDNGCNCELFTNSDFIECESLGELELLMPGETATHVEKWNLIKDVKMPETADEIDAVVEKYINK